jgi:hypothetical protein
LLLLEGTDINDILLNQPGITVNPDALAEVNIISSTLDPQFSRNSGAIVDEALKSGTNQFHGSGFEFYRDTFLNSGNYLSATMPVFHQNVFLNRSLHLFSTSIDRTPAHPFGGGSF